MECVVFISGQTVVHPIDPESANSALDYPPFFAYFEKLLSIPAYFIDPRIVDLQNLNYDSWSVIAYQRSSVIVTELVLATALLRYACFLPCPHYALGGLIEY